MKIRFSISKYVLILAILTASITSSWASISFKSLNIEEAVTVAKQTGKLVFVDTYASWCAPCKVMDKVFAEAQVGDYFNQHFINIKIDMDGPYGESMLLDYEVVWLPTLLIINGDGKVLSKIDYLVAAEELIMAADEAREGYRSAPTTSLESNPFSQGQKVGSTDYNPVEKEKVIYVHDDKTSSGRPHIMYHEAYLHFQLKDGKHMQVVRKYLSTQPDWSTEKNIKFIFDFMQSVKSPEFDYFLKNRSRFEEVIGKEKVDISLSFLINQRLEKGYPRPGLDEVILLYKYLDPKSALIKGYKYFLNRMLSEKKYDDYIKTAQVYLHEINSYDHYHINEYAKLIVDRGDSEQLKTCEEKLLITIVLEDQNPDYRLTLAKLYHKLGQQQNALLFIDEAIEVAVNHGHDSAPYDLFKSQIVQGR